MSKPLPGIEGLGHGISVIPLPLPFDSPSWVNAYVIETPDGITLIDCGVDWEPGHTRLMAGFTQLGLDPSAVVRLVVSHLHPDHVGMAPRLTRELNCELVMHRNAVAGVARYNDTPALAAWLADFGSRHGVPRSQMAGFAHLYRPDFMPLLDLPTVAVDDGGTIEIGGGRSLEVLHTPGHEHSHICMRDSLTGILFSGDHILPRITPVIMWDETDSDVLGMFLASVGRLVDLDIGTTYPAHGGMVERGSRRAEQILLHHERRLDGMEDVVARGPHQAWTVMLESFRPNLTSLQQRLALRETVSHLERLRLSERIRRFHEDSGIWYRSR